MRRFITEYIMDPENSIDPNNMTDKLRDKAALELETRDDFPVEKGRDIIIISQVLKQKLAEMRTGAQRAEEKKRRRGEISVTTAESSDDEEYRPDLSTAGVTKRPRQRLVISDSENET